MHKQNAVGVLGAGSMGCLLAAYLYRAKYPVTLLLKNKKSLQRYQKCGGIRIKVNNRETLLPIPALTIDAISNYPIIFICLKAFAIEPALKKIPPPQLAKLHFCFFNNGLGVIEQIKGIVHPDQCLLISHYLAATRFAAFNIEVMHISPLWIGQLEQKKASMAAKKIIQILIQAKFSVHWDKQIKHRLWKKFALNCALNPMTALLNCRNGFLITQPELNPLLRKICNEITLVAQHVGIPLTTDAQIRFIKTVARATKNNYSSMLQDMRAHRKTEIDYLNGYLVRTAKKLKLAVPYNQMITKLIQTHKYQKHDHETN